MERKRDGLAPIGESVSGVDDGPMKNPPTLSIGGTPLRPGELASFSTALELMSRSV